MKKFLLIAAAAVLVATMTGCGSLRTPKGENKDKVWYHTFFGLSVESALYGDGFVVGK